MPLLFLFTLFQGALSAQELGRFISTHSDPWIPNFGHPSNISGPVFYSIQDGVWSDPETWGGATPTADATAVVSHSLTYSSESEVFDLVLQSGGRLSFSTTENTRLTLGTIQVHKNATLEIGTLAQPMEADAQAIIVFKDRAFDHSLDPAQYGNGLIVFGNLDIHGSPHPSPFVRLADEALAGDSMLNLESPAIGWKIGDELMLPDTRQTDPRPSRGFVSQSERATVTAISGDGKTISITPIQHSHRGARNGDNQIEYLPHLGNTSRNVILRSENPNGVRGHTQFIGRAQIDIRYASFQDMGRTTAEALDSTAFDANGSPTKIGTNQVARYAIHTHHLLGPESPQSNGFQYTLIGNVVDGGTSSRLEKWGITIHGSHDGLIQDNIVINYTGANIVTEDGSESFNLFDHNFSIQCPAFGALNTHDRGTAGTGFWFRGQNNYMRNNVAADHAASGYSINAYRLGNESTTIPVSQGSLTRKPVNINTLPILEFSNNECYGPAFFGLDLWEIGSTGETLYDVAVSTIKNFTAWHVRNRVIDFYRSHRILLDGVVIRGDIPSLSSRFNNPVGISLVSTYRVRNYTVRNADIQGMRVGIDVGLRVTPNDTPLGSRFSLHAPQDRPGIINIEDSYLRNYIDISIHTRKRGGSPRQTKISNVVFDPLNISEVSRVGPQRTISTSFSFGLDNNAVSKDQIFVEDYQGIDTNDFQVFNLEQAPTFIVPQSTSNGRTIGSPVAGLTNDENWTTFGIAVAGEVAPCADTATFPEIRGFTCGVDLTPPPPSIDTEAPSTPTGLVATQITENSIMIAWAPSTDDTGVTGYFIQNAGAQISSVSSSSFSHLNLPPGTSFQYSVVAYDAAGNLSPESSPLTVTTDIPQATGALIQIIGRDQDGNHVPGAKIRFGSHLYDDGSELFLEFHSPYNVRGENLGILGSWRPIEILPGQTEIGPLFHSVSTSAKDQNQLNVSGGAIRISGISAPVPSGPSDTVALPDGARVAIRAEREGILGPWSSSTFSTGLLSIGQRFWTTDSSARDQENQLVTGNLRVSNYGRTVQTDASGTLTLPMGVRVNIRAERQSVRGAWLSKTFDEALSQLGTFFWTTAAVAIDQHGNEVTDAVLRISGFYDTVPTTPGSELSLPMGARVNIRPERKGLRGAWNAFSFSDGLETIGGQFQTLDTVITETASGDILDGLLTISGFQGGSFPSGDEVTLPRDVTINVRAKVDGTNGGWNGHRIAALSEILDVSY
jgi:hypothetical protein